MRISAASARSSPWWPSERLPEIHKVPVKSTFKGTVFSDDQVEAVSVDGTIVVPAITSGVPDRQLP
jgi:hypothetical protein